MNTILFIYALTAFVWAMAFLIESSTKVKIVDNTQ